MSTLRDVAEATGVSLATASLALNSKHGVSEETRTRVREVARSLRYVPPAERRQKPTQGFIGFVIEQLPFPVFSDIFYGEVVRGIDHEAHEFGFTTGFAVVEPEKPADARTKVARMLKGNRARGLIIVGGSSLTDHLVAELAGEQSRIVLLDNYLYQVPLDSIQMDHMVGGYLATQHLIELGHREIGFIAGAAKYKTLSDRADGYRRAMQDVRLAINPSWVVQPPGMHHSKKGYHEMRQLIDLPKRPTAVFAVSDKAAFGALDAIREAGLRVPDDISIVGFDDVAETQFTDPPLTTIAVPKRLMGQLAVRLLAERLSGTGSPPSGHAYPRKIVVPVELVIRGSTAPPGREAATP